MTRFFAWLAFCALPIYAVDWKSGFLEAGPFYDKAKQYVDAVTRTPNFTNTAHFERTYNGSQEQWALRLNISDLRVVDLTKESKDLPTRVPNTQYDLQWPGGAETFQAFLAERNVSVGFTTRIMDVWYNVTSQYNDSDTSCASMFGEKCAAAIADNAAAGQRNPSDSLPKGCNLNSYVIPRDPWSMVEWSALSFDFDMNSTWNENDNATLERGDTLFYYAGETFAPEDPEGFERAKAAVHIFTMAFNYSNSRFEQGEDSGPTVLCRIVQKPTEDLFDDAAAAVWRRSTAGLLGVALLGAIAMVW